MPLIALRNPAVCTLKAGLRTDEWNCADYSCSAPSRENHSGMMQRVDSITVAGAVLAWHDFMRTSFPFNFQI